MLFPSIISRRVEIFKDMFSALSESFFSIFSKLAGKKTITADNIQEAVNEIRLTLLEADVQYSVVKNFIKQVKEKAEGQEVFKNVAPAQQFAKIVHDELVALMGSQEEPLAFKKAPACLMLAGLQGSGKTTTAVKLASYLKKKGSHARPCVVALDLQRPAAVEQLQMLANDAQVDCFSVTGASDPIKVAQNALHESKNKGWDILIFDTAGRLHIDEALMHELASVKEVTAPEEVLYVANAATGQDAVKSALSFSESIGITGTILTMLDGTARAGAAISIRHVTGKPLKFEGIGEKIGDFQLFNPVSMADRILGMGDTINLVRKAQEHIKEEDAQQMQEKIATASFTYDDFLKHSKMMRKMGSMKSLLGMVPGLSMMKDQDIDEKEMGKFEAMVLSMTTKERHERCELHMSRRKRIAKGSGTSLDEVNRMIKSFRQLKEVFKNFSGKKSLQKMLGGLLWR